MNAKSSPLIAVALLGLGAYLFAQQRDTSPAKPDAIPAPSVQLQQNVAQVQTLLQGHPDAPRIAAAYAGAANILETPRGEKLATSGQIREYVASIGEYLAGDRKLGPSGFGVAADLAFKREFGLENGAIERAKAVAFLRAMAWAAGG